MNGFNSKLFGNKFDDQDLLNVVKHHDIVGFTETHLPKDETLSLPGFSAPFVKSRQKSDKNNKASGGIAVFVKNYLVDSKAICHVHSFNQNIVWMKLKKDKFCESEDIYIGTVYLSPDNYER